MLLWRRFSDTSSVIMHQMDLEFLYLRTRKHSFRKLTNSSVYSIHNLTFRKLLVQHFTAGVYLLYAFWIQLHFTTISGYFYDVVHCH